MLRRIRIFVRLVLLGANPVEMAKMAWGFAATRRGGAVTVRIRAHGKVFPVIISGPADRTVMREVFVDREYDIATAPNPQIIVDVGANVGMASLFLASRFPECEVHAIEPCPKTYERLVENTRALPNIRTHNLAISSQSGTAAFYVNEAHFGSSLIQRGGSDERKVDVFTRTLDGFIDDLGVDRIGLLKFDLEGYEAEMMRGLDARRVAQFVGELHFDLMPERAEWFVARMSGMAVVLTRISEHRSILHAA